jgi:hypothetical protein
MTRGTTDLDTGVLAYPSASYPILGKICGILRQYNVVLSPIIRKSIIHILERFCHFRGVLLHVDLGKLALHLNAGTCIITDLDRSAMARPDTAKRKTAPAVLGSAEQHPKSMPWYKEIPSVTATERVTNYAQGYNKDTNRFGLGPSWDAVDVHIDRRVLHKLYLPASKAAVQEADATSVVCSYSMSTVPSLKKTTDFSTLR